MVNKKFEAYKLKRELKRTGIRFEFTREGKNPFNEPDVTFSSNLIGSLIGLYHEQGSGVQISTSESAKVRTKKVPMILCLYKDVLSLNLQVGDIVMVNKLTCKVSGIVNIQEWNIIADISLEVVDDGYPV